MEDAIVPIRDVNAEYAALRTNAIVIDRSDRGRMRFIGEKAGEVLTGLVTSDVLALAPGHGQYAAALSGKGKIIADLRIFALPAAYLVDTSAAAWPGFAAMVRKYVNPRLAGYRDESFPLRDLGVFGPRARAIVASIASVPAETLEALAPYAHVAGRVGEHEVLVARAPDVAVEGYDLLASADAVELLRAGAIAAGAVSAGAAVWAIARVEAGRPEWGVDIDDTTIPQEANLDALDAISYTKGCYVGQELVARVHFRGHVNRQLRGLQAAEDDATPTGAQLIDGGGNHVGDVRSSVVSPRLGAIALAMVRREVAPGTRLVARSDRGDRAVDVVSLPFAS